MCTAVTYKTKDFYFGRTLDYEFSYGDEVVITPRNYCFHFLEQSNINNHYAIIGMAYVNENLPLAKLHWIISDSEESITVESVAEGVKIYENPIGVLTNNPSLDKQMFE